MPLRWHEGNQWSDTFRRIASLSAIHVPETGKPVLKVERRVLRNVHTLADIQLVSSAGLSKRASVSCITRSLVTPSASTMLKL